MSEQKTIGSWWPELHGLKDGAEGLAEALCGPDSPGDKEADRSMLKRLEGLDDVSILEFDGMTDEECEAAGLPTVEVQEFDGGAWQAPQFCKRSDGVITDRQLLMWFPVDKFPPPTEPPCGWHSTTRTRTSP